MRRYTLDELEALPTLSASQADDLKIDTGSTRVWLARVTKDDGADCDNEVTVEQRQNGRWVTVETYQAL